MLPARDMRRRRALGAERCRRSELGAVRGMAIDRVTLELPPSTRPILRGIACDFRRSVIVIDDLGSAQAELTPRTMFYPDKAHQFLEAVLNSPEKLRGLDRASKAVSDLNAGRSNGCPPATEPALAADWPKSYCALPNS
jgi:hypothetical protein